MASKITDQHDENAIFLYERSGIVESVTYRGFLPELLKTECSKIADALSSHLHAMAHFKGSYE